MPQIPHEGRDTVEESQTLEGSKLVKAFVGEGAELQGLPSTVVRGSLMTPQRVGFCQK